MKIKLSKSQWEEAGRKAGWIATNEDFPNAGKKCPKCNTVMRKHPNKEKADKGYKNCPNCNTTYSPESQTKQASNINIGAPGSRERVKREYPNLIKKLQEAKVNGHPIEIAQEILQDAGINLKSLDAQSLLEASGWRSDKYDQEQKDRKSGLFGAEYTDKELLNESRIALDEVNKKYGPMPKVEWLINKINKNLKITISKSQWEEAGRKAGWMKTAQDAQYPRVCPECKGKKLVTERIKNLGTSEYRDSTQLCPTCNGKGFLTKEDHDAQRHREGIGPCPYRNDVKDSSKSVSIFDLVNDWKDEGYGIALLDYETGKVIQPYVDPSDFPNLIFDRSGNGAKSLDGKYQIIFHSSILEEKPEHFVR